MDELIHLGMIAFGMLLGLAIGAVTAIVLALAGAGLISILTIPVAGIAGSFLGYLFGRH